jgi:hypothetical protein
MADVNEGLGTSEAGESVNSEAGFEAAMAAKVGRSEELEGREPRMGTSIAEGLEVAGEPKRDEAGRFAAEAPEPEAVEPEEPTDEVEEPEGETPDELAALLAQHDNDPLKALAAVEERRKNAESLIGRQGNDLGEERRAREALEARLAALEQSTTQPMTAAPALSTEQIEEMVSTEGGFNAALWAVNNRPDLYEKVHRAWALEDPDAAADFRLDYKLHLQQQAFDARLAQVQAPDPYLVSQKTQAGINSTLSTLADEVGDEWKTIAPHMMTALESVPQRVLAMVNSEDGEERLDAARIVADKARLLAGSELRAAAKAQQAAAGTERKKAATVLGAGQRPAAPAAAEGQAPDRDAAIAAFKKELLGTETTSVNEGLTFAKS